MDYATGSRSVQLARKSDIISIYKHKDIKECAEVIKYHRKKYFEIPPDKDIE